VAPWKKFSPNNVGNIFVLPNPATHSTHTPNIHTNYIPPKKWWKKWIVK
jgi:hypothetical protein